MSGASLSTLLAHCSSPVIPPWKKFKEFVPDHRVYEAMKKSFMNSGEQANSSEPAGFLPFFLCCLFSFGISHGKKKDLRGNFGKFSTLAYLYFHQNTRLNSYYPQWECWVFSHCYRGLWDFFFFFCMFRYVNIQFNRIFNKFLKCTLSCYKRAFCSRLKYRFYDKEER